MPTGNTSSIMKRYWAALLLALALLALPASSQSITHVTAYYPTWAWSNGFTDQEVPWDCLTHIILFSTNPMTSYPYYDSTMYFTYESWIPTLIATAHAKGVKIILCVGGVWGTGAAMMDSISVDSVKTYTFTERAASFAYRKGFDGIDIDWETNMANQVAHDRMLRAFNTYLSLWPTKGLLTIAETQAVGSTYGYTASAINQYVDQANIMSYDLGLGSQCGFNAPLHVPNYAGYSNWTWDDHGPQQLTAIGVKASKVGAGIPFYARGNFSVTYPSQTKTSYSSPYYNYETVKDWISSSTYHWDAQACVPWLADSSGMGSAAVTFVSYDDSVSVAAKVRYADSLGLGGIMIYELRNGWVESQSSVKLRNPLAYSVSNAIASLKSSPTTDSTAVPTGFTLSQNYPNPFNPSTAISYTLLSFSHVRIIVYNILGQKIATLVDRDQDGGTYSVEFSSKNLPSGMYFYRMQAGASALTKRMVVVK